jgi:hypothetical protein
MLFSVKSSVGALLWFHAYKLHATEENSFKTAVAVIYNRVLYLSFGDESPESHSARIPDVQWCYSRRVLF